MNMKKLLILIVFLLSGIFLFAQPTQAELEKRMKAAQAEIEKLKNDPKYKDIMKNMPDMDSVMKKMPNKTLPATTKVLEPDRRILPGKNSPLLSQLPKKILNKNELGNYLNTLNVQLFQKINSTSKDSANLMAKQLSNSGETLSSAAIVAWYKNDPEAAALLAIRAATLSIDDNTSLNNCAAILSISGLENKAIPILQVLLQREPNSTTVLNNLGQAFAGLGELNTAMYYFGRCIKIAPEHPEANNTAAIICVKKGQMEQAKNYCTQSLKGGLTSEAVRTYGHLFKDNDIEKLIDIEPWKSYPFNEHDFTFPLQCEKTEDAAEIKSELDAYANRYRAFFEKYEKGYNAEMRSKAAKMNAQYASNPLANMAMLDAETVYTRRAGYAYHRISYQLLEEIYDVTIKHYKEIDTLKVELAAKQKALDKKRDKEIEACGNSNLCEVKAIASHCSQQNDLSNQYLPKFAVINRDYVSKRWRLAKEEFEAFSVYLRMAVKHNTIQYFSEEATRIAFISSPLTNGVILNDGYQVIMPYCDLTDAEIKRIDELELGDDKNCNLNIKLPLGPVKLTFKCDEFEIEGGELIKAKYNKNFRSGQTTLYAGVGVSDGIPGFKVGAVQYIFVCFDRNNQPVDIGTHGELKLNVAGVSEKIVLRTSLNTGVNFDPGPLKALTNVLPYAFK